MIHSSCAPDVGRRTLMRSLGASALAIAAATAAPAWADCTPDPPVSGGTVVCTGVDADGLALASFAYVRVDPAAEVLAGPGAGAAIAASQYVSVQIDGSVSGGAAPGLRLVAGDVQIGAAGVVSGTAAIRHGSGFSATSIRNSGRLVGTAGPALVADQSSSFGLIDNGVGATIGGIAGQVNELRNAGLIDGGTASAFAATQPFFFAQGVTNSGTIRSSGTAATMDLVTRSIVNQGTIENFGSGAAVAATNDLTIDNGAGGRIASAGELAIRTAGLLQLTNAGTIAGSVTAGGSGFFGGGSVIDSGLGTISGNLQLGASNDTVVAEYAGGALVTGVAGQIDAGGGTNTLRARFRTDATVGTIDLPAGFQQLELSLIDNARLTLAPGFTASQTLRIGGVGTLVNQATLNTTGPAIQSTGIGSPAVVNDGAITAQLASEFDNAVSLSSGGAFTNSGTVDAVGGGGVFVTFAPASLNSGTISATGTAVSLVYADFANSGLVRSTGEEGHVAVGGFVSAITNSGRIEGNALGASVGSGSISNSGVITAQGRAVALNGYASLINTGRIESAEIGVTGYFSATIDNRAGGIITGGTAAISSESFGPGITVANAGTINGNVALGNPASPSSSGNSYFALAGGILNGDLYLGGGNDRFITDLGAPFAGVTGTVTGGGRETIRYRVTQDSSATLALPAPFSVVGYDLYDGAALTLTAAAPQDIAVSLAGTGRVDLSADLTQTGQDIVTIDYAVVPFGGQSAPSAIDLTSRGSLTLTLADQANAASAVRLGAADRFTNEGTISVLAGSAYGVVAAVAGGARVVNNGAIRLANASGIAFASDVVNAGTITQTGGTTDSSGVMNVRSLVNSGTIAVGGDAVTLAFGFPISTVDNSGTIASSNGYGITITNSYLAADIYNRAGGTISGGKGAIAIGGGSTVVNAGTINGDVDLGYSIFGFSFGSSTYIADGGTLNGNLRFGQSDDLFVVRGAAPGVTGTIDAGGGLDSYVRSFTASTTVALGTAIANSFEREGVEALGRDTIVTLTGPAGGLRRSVSLFGDGAIVNTADTTNRLTLAGPIDPTVDSALAFTNQAAIADGISGRARSFANTGTIGSATLAGEVVYLSAQAGEPFSFANSGTIRALGSSGYPVDDYYGYYDAPAVTLDGFAGYPDTQPGATIANSGTIDGGLRGSFAGPVELTNSGTISRNAEVTGTLVLSSVVYDAATGVGPAVTVRNSGTISAAGRGGAALVALGFSAYQDDGTPAPPFPTLDVVNSGTISATAPGEVLPGFYSGLYYVPSTAVGLVGERAAITLANQAGGTITAADRGGIAVVVNNLDGTFTLDNAGTIGGAASVAVAEPFGVLIGSTFTIPPGALGGAVNVVGAATTLRNSGTITGSIRLDGLADRIENSGRIVGDVFLLDGDDSFVQRGAGSVTGRIDGGAGSDAALVEAIGVDGAVSGDQFVNFESFAQTGTGNVTYSGNFAFDTIRLSGGTITVAAGTTLRSSGLVAITGSEGGEAVANYGTIAGAVSFGGGSDSYTEGAASAVGGVDGGAGSDTYVVALAGDRSGIGASTGFEQLSVVGSGTLSLTLGQNFDAIGLSGTGLDLRLAGFAVGGIDGSDGAERVTLDGDVARVSLGGGNDLLRIGSTALAGRYDGGGGSDSIALTGVGMAALSGTIAGFEAVTLSGPLVVTGTLGATGEGIAFGDGAQALTIANGGRLLGSVDLGGGADSFRLAAGGQLLGSVSGGAGADSATLELTADLAIAGETLRDIEALTTTGGRTLTFSSGTSRFDRIDAAGGLAVASGAALDAAQVQFGGGNDRFAIAGAFTGSADGGAGSDALELSGGTPAAPIAFQTIAGFETLTVTGGVTTIGGAAQIGRIDMTGGRLIGLAASTITAPQIAVGAGATFGSAGSVIGNLAVAGTLSPGGSPGTMTVTGNVALASGSTTFLELTPAVSDKLAISGTLSIAGGSTLTLSGARPLTPGAALDLIVAGGGITGSFATINQPATILGFLRQSADRIQLFGQFAAAGFNPQVTATINYVNALLTGGQASTALIAAVPSLLTTGNATNGAAFARLNPEAYASATQISIGNGLTLAKAARTGAAAAPMQAEAGAFTFAQGLGDWRSLDGDAAAGTSRAKLHSYGLLGGIGYGTERMSLGGFVGYLDTRQRIGALAARTDSDGVVAGLIGHVSTGGFDLSALLAYDGGKADTQRTLPGGGTAAARYGLRGWVSDTAVGYALPLGASWSLRPAAGLTYVSTRRGGAVENGGGPFALSVASRRSHATFVDGSLTLNGGTGDQATFRPWLSAGVRHQLNGQATLATAGFAGAATSFSVIGVRRQATLATAGAGIALGLAPGLDLFGAYRGEFGKDGTGTNLNGGVRLRF